MATELVQVCERINDTFVVKCVEKIQEPLKMMANQLKEPIAVNVGKSSESINVVVTQMPATTMTTGDWLTVGVGVLGAVGTILAAWAAIKASSAAKQANMLAKNEAEANEKRNHLSVKPLLSFKSVTDYGGDMKVFTLFIFNGGVGPAIIKNLSLSIGDVFIFGGGKFASLNSSKDPRCAIVNLLKTDNLTPSVELELLGSGSVLSPNSALEIIKVSFSGGWKSELDEMKSKLRFRCEYEDMYGNKMDDI